MKKLIKLTLVVVLVLSSTSLFAQKMGRINSQELISLMPETTQMQTDLQTYATELNAQIEEVQVEFNNKLADVNNDGIINILDASCVQRYVAVMTKKIGSASQRLVTMRSILSEVVREPLGLPFFTQVDTSLEM